MYWHQLARGETAVKRFCLPCSKESGVLVERAAPTLEKKRLALKAKAKTKKLTAKKKTQSKNTVNGVDVMAEWKKALRLKGVRDHNRNTTYVKSKGFTLTVRRSKATPNECTGQAWPWTGRVVMSVGVACDRAEIVGVLLHELAHLLTPQSPGHCSVFWGTFCELVEQYTGNLVTPSGGTNWARHNSVVCQLREAMNE